MRSGSTQNFYNDSQINLAAHGSITVLSSYSNMTINWPRAVTYLGRPPQHAHWIIVPLETSAWMNYVTWIHHVWTRIHLKFCFSYRNNMYGWIRWVLLWGRSDVWCYFLTIFSGFWFVRNSILMFYSWSLAITQALFCNRVTNEWGSSHCFFNDCHIFTCCWPTFCNIKFRCQVLKLLLSQVFFW